MGYIPPVGPATNATLGTVKLTNDFGGTANLPTVPKLLDKAEKTTTITGASSVSGGGDLSANRSLALVNDQTTPGNSKYYGTNISGTKGFYDLPVGGGGGGAVPGVIVAANDSPAAWKSAASYTCDGTADEVEINQAIVAASTAEGKVTLAPGNYNTMAPVDIISRVTLQGHSWGRTAIKASAGHSAINSTTSGVVTFSDPVGKPYDDLALRDVTISGSSQNINGIYSAYAQTTAAKDDFNWGGQPDHNNIIQYVQVINCKFNGLHLTKGAGSASTSWRLDHVRVFSCCDADNGYAAFNLDVTDAWVTNCDSGSAGGTGNSYAFICNGSDNAYTNCIAWTTKGTGFLITGAKTTYTGCISHHSTADGFRVTNNRNKFVGCLAYNNAVNGFYNSANNNSWMGCQSFDDNDSFTVTGRPQDNGWYLDQTNSSGVEIVGCSTFNVATPVAGPGIDTVAHLSLSHTGDNVNGSAGTKQWLQRTAGLLVMQPITGSPEGVITAKVGSSVVRTDGAVGSTHYVKESGTGNTGWVAK